MDIPSLILLFLICAIGAHFFLKWWWPIIKERKNLTPEQMIERALQAPAKGAQRDAYKFGSPIKTLVIIVLNANLLYGWLWFSHRSIFMLWIGLLYLIVGFVVQHLVKIPSANEMSSLKFWERLWLRIFYAWFWPIYVPYILRRN
ncbi:hypothetical protein CSQ92_27600 [Janthinobacterium sp. BJB446]|uniref:hypothetical protein n=1 Tax=Janthinobacterium sp. BJB446 TaxID=2048009 RepID=UPI000C0E35E9|nr:hypothetical protein [Janthinobacterium sp. BJB446]PHV19142.1 hypothetical protein CSQ92_27600 [Janthinobacterium sp. BJB446]